ncbi:hypothetical protein HBH49_039700 [Parastagonospora nodorum]|nr:hypothetical protein HBH49_039700 [Parastagonospora nodorum]
MRRRDLERREMSIHQDHLGSSAVYTCPNEGCAIPGKGFAHKEHWQRHVKHCKENTVDRAAHENDWGATTSSNRRSYAASNSSSSFSYADSVLSTTSLASSATDLSKHSVYSADQIARATKELIIILQEDTNLATLYRHAIQDASIGPERLERNLRRLFRSYAELLDKAAGDTIELLASRLVKWKARAVARSIVQKYDSHERALMIVSKIRSEQDQSSEEENDVNTVDESVFEDLAQFREFLVRGEALTTLQTQIRIFEKYSAETSTRTLDTTTDVGNTCAAIDTEDIPSSESKIRLPVSIWKMNGLLGEMKSSVLIALRYMDPPLQKGFIRLRWHCRCGDTFSGDVTEYREGGVDRMVERMERTTGSTVTVTSYKQAAAAAARPKYTFRLPSWMKRGTTKLSSAFGPYTKSPAGLPQHKDPGLKTPCVPQDAELQPAHQTLHLMACTQQGRYRRIVYQDRVDQISTDQALFCFMRNQLAKHRGKIRKIFSLKCVRGIYFVKFRLRVGGNAEVRNHEPCCTSSFPRICECIPPALKVEPSPDAEYRCAPAGPLDTWPPVLSEELMHMLTSPQCVNPKETFVLEQLPKRTKGELIGTIGRSVEGWGIHFQEGWDFDLLIGLVLAVFLLASLLFAVLWSHFKLDVQGAFGVSSYMVTASGIFVAWFANRAGKLG